MKKQVRRTPIVLNKNTIAMLHIFTKLDNLEDMFFQDFEPYIEENYQQHKKAANELMNQLEDHYCTAFLEALIVECLDRIKNSDLMFGSNHYKSTSERLQLLLNKIQDV